MCESSPEAETAMSVDAEETAKTSRRMKASKTSDRMSSSSCESRASVISHHGNDFDSYHKLPDGIDENDGSRFDVTPQRWVVLLALSLLILSQSMGRASLSPVAYVAAEFYDTEVTTINWSSIVYMVVGIPLGFLTPLFMERRGVRFSLLLAACFNLIGSIVRCVSVIESFDHRLRIALLLIGHILPSAVQPILMFSPSLIASHWFGDDQRVFATSLSVICNPLGCLAAFLLSPTLVVTPDDISTLHLVYMTPCAVAALVTILGVRTSRPQIPPSLSALQESEPFLRGIRKILPNRQFWLLFACLGGAIGIFTVLTVLMEQILCPWGFDRSFSGPVCGTCLILTGVVGAGLASKVADRIKKFVFLIKTTFMLSTGGFAVFVFNQSRSSPVIAAGLAVMGFFALPILPLGNELAVEMTYPVDPATSSGLIFIGGQLQSMVLLSVVQKVAIPLDVVLHNTSSCLMHSRDIIVNDLHLPTYVLLGYAFLLGIILSLFLKTDYKRLQAEQRKVVIEEDGTAKKTNVLET